MTRAEAKRRARVWAADILYDRSNDALFLDHSDTGEVLSDADTARMEVAWADLVEELRRRGERRKKGARK